MADRELRLGESCCHTLRSIDFAITACDARRIILQDSSYEIILADWISSLTVSQDFKERLLMPWISVSIGATVKTTLHLATPVLRLEKTGNRWYLHSQAGRERPLDRVVINAQPQHSKLWVADLPGAEGLHRLLDAITISIHAS